MSVQIEFFENIRESSLPIIRLTKSKNKTTGTATFIFIRPFVFDLSQNLSTPFKQMSLVWNNKKIITTDIEIFFDKGKPILIKSLFIFNGNRSQFEFLSFMQYYSKETGLSFTEIPK
jgi:photosystem II protein